MEKRSTGYLRRATTVAVTIAIVATALMGLNILSAPASPGLAGHQTGLTTDSVRPQYSNKVPVLGNLTLDYMNGTSTTTTAGIYVGTGNAVFVSVCIGTGATLSTITDSQSITPTHEQTTVEQPGGVVSSQYTYAIKDVSAGSLTVSVTTSSSTKALIAVADLGAVNVTHPVDAVGPGHANSTNLPYDTVSTTQHNDLGVLAVCLSGKGKISADGDTLLAQGIATSNGYYVTGGILTQAMPSKGYYSEAARTNITRTVEADVIAFADPPVYTSPSVSTFTNYTSVSGLDSNGVTEHSPAIPVPGGDAAFVATFTTEGTGPTSCRGAPAQTVTDTGGDSFSLVSHTSPAVNWAGSIQGWLYWFYANNTNSVANDVFTVVDAQQKCIYDLDFFVAVVANAGQQVLGATNSAVTNTSHSLDVPVTTQCNDSMTLTAVTALRPVGSSASWSGSTAYWTGAPSPDVEPTVANKSVASDGTNVNPTYATSSSPALAGGTIEVRSGAGCYVPQHPIQHVVVIMMENQQQSTIWANAPYADYLQGTYGNDSSYYAACHGSSPNYVAMVAAVTNQCGWDGADTWSNTTLAEDLTSKGFTWSNAIESVQSVGGPSGLCSNPAQNDYPKGFAYRHVAFDRFNNVTSGAASVGGSCTSHLVDSTTFNQSIDSTTMANFTFYSPNMWDQGHTYDGWTNGTACDAAYSVRCAVQANAWLKGFLSPILNGTANATGYTGYETSLAKYNIAHTVFLVSWDEAATGKSNSGYIVAGALNDSSNTHWCSTSGIGNGDPDPNGGQGDTVCGGNVFMAAVSPYSLGLSMNEPNAVFGIAGTVEWLFGLGPLHNPDNYDSAFLTPTTGNNGFPTMQQMFDFSSNNY